MDVSASSTAGDSIANNKLLPGANGRSVVVRTKLKRTPSGFSWANTFKPSADIVMPAPTSTGHWLSTGCGVDHGDVRVARDVSYTIALAPRSLTNMRRRPSALSAGDISIAPSVTNDGSGCVTNG